MSVNRAFLFKKYILLDLFPPAKAECSKCTIRFVCNTRRVACNTDVCVDNALPIKMVGALYNNMIDVLLEKPNKYVTF